MNELLQLSATRQAALIRERRLSSRELIAAHLEQIRRINPALNAAVQVFEDEAVAEAPGSLGGFWAGGGDKDGAGNFWTCIEASTFHPDMLTSVSSLFARK